MSDDYSFWQTTQRQIISGPQIRKAQESYSFNYDSLLPKAKDARIVELGCSEGIALEWLAGQGYTEVFAIDSDAYAINMARRRLSGVVSAERIVAGDALEFVEKMESNSVSLMLMLNVIEHLRKDVLLEIVPEIRRVLMPGGKFIAQTGNIENPLNFGLYARDFTHEIPFTSSSLKQLMMMGGFKRENVAIFPLRHRWTLKNFPLHITSAVLGGLLKASAYCLRIRIDETAPLIYAVAEK